MAKRMTDTEKWRDDWFVALAPEHKILWLYIVDNCDHAGVWRVSSAVAAALIGAPVDLDKAKAAFADRVQELEGGYWWLTKFIRFQYGLPLNPSNKVHSSVVKVLVARGIDPSPFQAPSEGLASPYQGVKDKDKDSSTRSVKVSLLDYERDENFMRFWKAWPSSCRKGSPVEAYKVWKTHNPPIDLCLSVIEWKKKSDLWTSVDPKGKDYIKGPAAWLNIAGWLEEKQSTRGKGTGEVYTPSPKPPDYDGIDF